SHETPRVHIAPERRGSRVAARRARSKRASCLRSVFLGTATPSDKSADRSSKGAPARASAFWPKSDCLEGHPTWIGTEFLTQSLRQGVNDSISVNAAARPDLVN